MAEGKGTSVGTVNGRPPLCKCHRKLPDDQLRRSPGSFEQASFFEINNPTDRLTLMHRGGGNIPQRYPPAHCR